MTNTIIIDDEQHCIDSLLRLTSQYKNTFHILGTYQTVQDGVKATELLQPDLVFLDVEIHDETGFDFLNAILNKFNEINFDIVFVTGYDKYALKAIKFSALDYLLKPIADNEFKDVIQKLNKKQSQENLQKQVETLIHNIKTNFKEGKITVTDKNKLTFINIEDIIYCKAVKNYTTIYTLDNKEYLEAKTLKIFEDYFSQNNFFRIHDTYLINMNHIKTYTRGKGGYVTMCNNKAIDVSFRRKSEFLKLIKKH